MPAEQFAPSTTSGDGGGKSRRQRRKDKKPQSNAAYAYQYLVHAGLSQAGAAGVVGNLVQESGVNPLSNQSGGPGRGIAQWSEGARWDSFLAFAQQHGLNPNALDSQLKFVVHEMQGYGMIDQFSKISDPAQAASIFMNTYERPAAQYANEANRIGQATAAFQGNWRQVTSAKNYQASGAAAPAQWTGNPGVDSRQGYDKLNPQELAAKYGWASSFLKSIPELGKLFSQATANNWSPAMFTAKFRDTQWFQTHSESMRQAIYLQSTDPKTYESRINALSATLRDNAASMGVFLDPHAINKMAEHSYLFGLSDAEVNNVVASHLKMVQGQYSGTAGDTQDQLQQFADANGIKLSGDWMQKAVENVAAGNNPLNFYTDHITKMAQSAFPGIKLESGQTVKDIADPYVQSMASLLEMPSAQINLFDPSIRNALSHQDPKTGQPMQQSLWDFEKSVRQDPRWLTTKNAMDSISDVGSQIMQEWGFN